LYFGYLKINYETDNLCFFSASFLFACNATKLQQQALRLQRRIQPFPIQKPRLTNGFLWTLPLHENNDGSWHTGQQHAMLAKDDGKWTAETTMWMSRGASPITAKSSAVNKMVFGGRYQQNAFKGDFMGAP
jgi:hypothetical protein